MAFWGHILCIGFVCGSALAASAEPKIIDFKERLTPKSAIGATASFLGVQQLSQRSVRASPTISFFYASGLGTQLCFLILSRDGRYRASALVDMGQDRVGEARVDLATKENSYITSLPEEELAIDGSYRDNCTGSAEARTRTVVWFDSVRPKSPVVLLLQGNDNDAVFASEASPRLQAPCIKLPQTSERPATAFNTKCDIHSSESQTRLRGTVSVIDLAGIPTKEIVLDVILK